MIGSRLGSLAVWLSAGLLLALLVVPLIALVATTGGSFLDGLRHPLVGPALRLSLETTAVSLVVCVALGTPLAWKLARARSRGWHALETLVQLPMVVPPAVAGVAMLLAFGRRGWPGAWLDAWELSPAFTAGAVVLAQVFVSAPFYVQAAIEAFRGVDARLLAAARGLGATPIGAFWRVALPLAARGLVAGAAMAWARALGEFGATLMFAGNVPGRTQTLPLAIYTALEVDLDAARSLSIVLVAVAFALLLALRLRGRQARLPPRAPERNRK